MNNIASLTREDGMVVKDHNEISNVAKFYFDNLYSGSNVELDEVINHVPLYLSSDDNFSLLAPFSIDEFKNVLFQMDSNKSPSPDGLNPTFYKKFWNLSGLHIFTAVTAWLESGSFPPQINRTSIVLIPKI